MALSVAAASSSVQAATATTTFVAQAQITSLCSATASLLDFGSYIPTSGTPNDATSVVHVFCTTGTAYTVKLNIGTGGGTFATRTLASGSDTLNFNLYSATGRTTILGDGTLSTVAPTGSGAGLLTSSSHTVYGRIPAGQDKPAGSYLSTITVTIEYT